MSDAARSKPDAATPVASDASTPAGSGATAPAKSSTAIPARAPGMACWYVRVACEEDVAEVAAAVTELLLELGATPPAMRDMQVTTHSLVSDGDVGVVLVAEAEGELVGVLAASWQTAIHVAGRYVLIQDLWVHRSWRSRAIGADLLAALADLAGGRQISRIEVGLPSEHFAGLRATAAFYRANGFAPLGARMRRLIE
jgi:branched-chain amino acid aminotransferase